MHDIWNPWHGCRKISEGCRSCYMYYLDRMRGRSGAEIYRTANFRYPLAKRRDGSYRVQSGEMLRVCMTSDFFLEEADPWRGEAWEIMARRPDVIFYLLTKRPERVRRNLPSGWGDGWENVFFNVTAENQRRADERMKFLLELPFKHKGVFCAPLIGPVDLSPYLASGAVEQVVAGGENYDGARVCDFDWVRSLHRQCREAQVNFSFIETGTRFRKDGRLYTMPDKGLQSRMAHKSGMSFRLRELRFRLTDPLGMPVAPGEQYRPHWRRHCATCGSQLICNGCSGCGKCRAE